MKDKMRRFFFLTIFYGPDGKLIDSSQDFDAQPIIDEVDTAFTGNLRYRRGTLEICPETGKFHMHFYVELFQSVRWSTVCKRTEHMFAKVKLVDHSRDRVNEYCGKTDDPSFLAGPFDYGERIPQRKDELAKSALDEVIDRVMDGASLRIIAREYPKTWIIFGKRIKEWLRDMGKVPFLIEEPRELE